MKKILAIVLTAVTFLTFIPTTVSADTVRFTDIDGHWAKSSIEWAADQGLVGGIGNDLFAPNATVTRATMATVLWRFEGKPDVNGTTPFTDLTQDWYQDAVTWAYHAGIINGSSLTTFTPDGPLSREQAATFFYRYAVYKNYRTYRTADLLGFPDGNQVHDWAEDAMAWAIGEGLIGGANFNGEVTLSPEVTADRGTLTMLLQRLATFVASQSTSHVAVPTANRYYYTTLTDPQKAFYRAMDQAVCDLNYEVNVNCALNSNDVYLAFCAYLADQPEKWYVGRNYTGTLYSDSATIRLIYADGVIDNVNDETGTITVPSQTLLNSIRTKSAQLSAKTEEIVAAIPTDITPVEKQKQIHDYLICNSRYSSWALTDNPKMAQDEWTACGVLLNGNGVCESYAEAFQMLCYRVGINCTSVLGLGNGGAHKWNAVQLENEWYLCDVTFDDPIINGNLDGPFDPNNIAAYHYYFFNLTDQAASDSHSASLEYNPPACTGTRYGYENYFA